MSRVNYKSTSPYFSTPQSSWFLSNFVHRDIPADGTDTLIVLSSKYELRPDKLSNDLYGTTNYWWVFCVLNPDIIKDPIYDFVAGIEISVPTVERLGKIL